MYLKDYQSGLGYIAGLTVKVLYLTQTRGASSNNLATHLSINNITEYYLATEFRQFPIII